MASTYSDLKFELMGTGDQSGTWGSTTNDNIGTAIEQAITGLGNPVFTTDANLTISFTNTVALQTARALVLNATSSGSLTATRELVVPTIEKQYIVQNNTTGSQSITVKTSAGTGITVTNGRKAHLYVDGTNVIQMFDFVDINGGAIDGTPVGAASASTGAFTTLSASGTATLSGLTASTALALDASKNAVSVTNTGTGNNVLATSPTLTTPVINGFTGDTSVINIGSGQVFKDASGNVGIGTAAPQGKLEVQGGYTTLGGFNAGTTGTSPTNGGISFSTNISNGLAEGNIWNGNDPATYANTGILFTQRLTASTRRDLMFLHNNGNVGIGTTNPGYKLEIGTDSAGKPGVGGLWTVVSDERIKSNIVPANLDRCYEIVKSVPLKHFGFAPGVYTDDQIQDKHNLGWIAQDVQKVFKNAVSVKPFTLKTDIPDGTEDYEEQDFTLESVDKTETSIQVINGKPVQVSKVVTSENKVMLFDTVAVLDQAGAAVMEDYEVTPAVPAIEATDEAEAVEASEAVMGTRPVTYQMPRMVAKTRPKVRRDVIEDCLDLNGGQMNAALYGAVQALMAIVDAQANRITTLEAK